MEAIPSDTVSGVEVIEPRTSAVEITGQPDPKTQFGSWTNTLLYSSQFLNGAANSSYYSFLAIWMRSHDFTLTQIGYVKGMAHLSILVLVPLCCLLVDFLSDNNRLKKQSLFSWWCIYGGISRLAFVYFENSWNVIFCGLIVITIAIQESSNSIMDSIILSVIPDPNQYGRFRLWDVIGWGAVALLLGLMFDSGVSIDAMFYIYCAFMGCLGWIWLFSTVRVKMNQHDYALLPDTDSVEDSEEIDGAQQGTLAVNPQNGDHISFLRKLSLFFGQLNLSKIQIIFSFFLFGICYGVISTFLFLRLLDLGASHLLMAMTLVVAICIEIPTFWFVDRALVTMGHLGIITVCMMAYMLRLGWYGLLGFHGLMLNPWYVMPAEILHGVTYGWIKASIAVFAHRLANDDRMNQDNMKVDLAAFSQGFLLAIFDGFGYGFGAVLGGIVYSNYGPHVVFFGTALGLVPFLSIYLVQCFVCTERFRGAPSDIA